MRAPFLPLLFDINVDNLVVIIRNDVVQEFKQLLELFQFPVLIFIKAFQLLLKLFANRRFELCERVSGGGITRRAPLLKS
jgi:hypothetical protein